MLRNKKSWVIIASLGVMAILSPLSIFFTQNVSAVGAEVNPSASLSRINRPTLLLGGVYFYDSDTTTKDENGNTFNAIGTECPASIVYRIVSTDSSSAETWTLKYQKKNETGGGCGADNTKTLSKPTNWTERKYVVFAGGSSDGKYISVLPTSNEVFKKGGTYNGDTVYIQQGVDAYSCPLVLVTNSRSTALIPLEKKDNEDDVSNQIKTLFSKELNVSDTACGPTDNDDLGIFKRFGLPESYYDAGNEKDHYETTDFGFSGENVGSATMSVGSIAQVAGIALQGPLKGGGYDASSDTSSSDDSDETAETTSCAIDGIGWLVCPTMSFIGKMNDAAYGFLRNILEIQPGLINSKSTQNAWAAFRDIANVAFVIAFMVIVYSQLTSAGITNYGVKKMLPRIVIAAILVNISFLICAIMVDVSNIVGSSIYSLLKDSIDVGREIEADAWGNNIDGILKGAATAVGIVLLVVALAMAPMALLAFFVIILIIVARQALVILLIVVAPLAFVAYLLPNTENWFKKWWKALTVALMVYPIVGAVFGASTLASRVLTEVAQGGDDNKELLLLIALGVLAIPLFAVPAILKGSLSAAGSIGTKIAGLADKTNRMSSRQLGGRVSQIGKGLDNYRSELAQQGKGIGRFDRFRRAQMRRDAKYEALEARGKAAAAVFGSTDPRASKYGIQKADAEHAMKTANVNLEASSVEARSLDEIVAHNVAQARLDSANRVKQQGYAEEVLANPDVARQAGGIDRYGQSRAVGLATQNLHKAYDDGVSAEKTTMSDMTHDQLIAEMQNSSLSSERRAAAAGTIMSRDYAEGHLQALEIAGQLGQSGTDEHISDIQKQMSADMKNKPFALGDQAAGQLKIGTYGKPQPPRPDGSIPPQLGDLNAELRERVEQKLSPASLAKMNPDEMNRIFDMSQKSVADGGLTDAQKKNLIAAIQAARSDDQYKGLIKPAEAKKHDKILQDAAAASYGPGI